MRISTSKSETVVLSQKREEYHFRFWDEVLPQAPQSKCLRVKGEGKVRREIDRQITADSLPVYRGEEEVE